MAPAKVIEPVGKAHPLDPPSKSEIILATETLRPWLLKSGVKAFKFVNVFLAEPAKADVIAAGFFPRGSDASSSETSGTAHIERLINVHVIDLVKSDAFAAVLKLDSNAGTAEIKGVDKLDAGIQPALTIEELCMAEECIRKDPRVIKLAEEVGVKADQLYADGWSIGWDKRFPNKRIQQCLTFARFGKDENLYGHPMDFFPILDNNTGEVLAIDFPQHRKGGKLPGGTEPPTEASFGPAPRERIPPPLERHDYLPELANAGPHNPEKPLSMRQDLKPLSVVQPEGVSFKRNGNVIEWQKWKMHVGFHPREGLVLSTISYGDTEAPGASASSPKERPLFYRLSLAEMVVPYAEPAHPHYRKFAFDVGEYGLGYLANSLSLGCDCLGSIEYMDGVVAKHDGTVEVIENAICMHEEDTGLLWKHTDYRVGGRAHNVRGRKFVISMVCTVANYEYQINWSFHLDGTIGLEIKLSGILNLYQLEQGEKPEGYGTEVAPRINAHYHQHLFSLRVDSHIDGPLNSIMESHIEESPFPAGSPENFAGNAFTAPYRIFDTAGEAVRDADFNTERSWTFVNEAEKHYSSGKPVGYKVVCKDMPRLYAKHDGFTGVRAPFAKHHLWTVPYQDAHRYPAGLYVPQTFEAPVDSIENWVGDGKASIRNKDIVSYVTIGTTHVPRPEDFPVMPAQSVHVKLEPIGFFARNPALDVPATNDAKSTPASAANGTTNGAPACCRS
ncbi:hypothetical protein IE81DRAFT_341451 [Ceraceosorus guamensis]|uniref:Amine oxidase n=1 Tax=Ceraceosorus guamensis TaxID=1522189 RepID=A0A316VYJ5_9BASI|nr:hypothetical protein IE81DRAFT_341451 [Ceraceosorus guamensis]PWN42404.1 hypothetical protein IE81DRAFT_341451 [Ceraceosorus guamensis]